MRIVAGKFRGKQLLSPPDDSIRPTSDRARESIFNILASRMGPHLDGVRVIDLFAGTGALGLEALSRGASWCGFLDMGRPALDAVRANVEALREAANAQILRADATKPPPASHACTLAFLDPPYGQGLAPRALEGLLRAGWLAGEHNVEVTFGNSFLEIGVNMALALPGVRWLEYSFQNFEHLVEEPFTIRDGLIHGSRAPGHGLVLSEAARLHDRRPTPLAQDALGDAPRWKCPS